MSPVLLGESGLTHAGKSRNIPICWGSELAVLDFASMTVTTTSAMASPNPIKTKAKMRINWTLLENSSADFVLAAPSSSSYSA